MAVADQGFLLFYFNGRLGFGLEAFVLEGHQSHTFSFPSSSWIMSVSFSLFLAGLIAFYKEIARTMTSGTYLITPAMGSHFVIYLAKMQENSLSGVPSNDVDSFIFVVQGAVTLTNVSGIFDKLTVDSYAYLPSNVDQSLRHVSLENQSTELIFGSTDEQPLLETPGEVFQLRKLIPASISYDFNIHIMDFQPGEYLNVKEVHDNQHGLLLLEGQDIYRLGDSWYPVQAGDVIWMAPFVPQ